MKVTQPTAKLIMNTAKYVRNKVKKFSNLQKHALFFVSVHFFNQLAMRSSKFFNFGWLRLVLLLQTPRKLYELHTDCRANPVEHTKVFELQLLQQSIEQTLDFALPATNFKSSQQREKMRCARDDGSIRINIIFEHSNNVMYIII